MADRLKSIIIQVKEAKLLTEETTTEWFFFWYLMADRLKSIIVTFALSENHSKREANGP